MRPYKICCMTYKTLDTLVREALLQINDPEVDIQVIEGLREEVIEKYNAVKFTGIEVIIAGGANAKIAREYCDLPVLNYKISSYDYLHAIKEGLALSKKIAVVSYKVAIDRALARYLEASDIDCSNILYEDTQELSERILQSDAEVFIGPSHPVEVASSLGRKTVLIYPGVDTIINSIEEAKILAYELRKSRENVEYAHALVKYSTNGVLILDSDGVIVDYSDTFTQKFSKEKYLKGKQVQEIFSDCGYQDLLQSESKKESFVREINGLDTYCTWIRLTHANNLCFGYIGLFQTMSEINQAQMKHQKKILETHIEKGFTAKISFRDIIGDSDVLHESIHRATLYAGTDDNIHIYGETGVGKEVFAQSIHNASDRKSGPFVAVNCAAFPEALLESELFGYEEGAFTGGKRGGKIGLFEIANKGTIFLDEVGELSPNLQSRLLRVIQEREFIRVGGERVVSVDIRIISASNSNLESLPPEQFRKDLYYRLNTLELHLPSLRERGEDVGILFLHFIKRNTGAMNSTYDIPETVLPILQQYSWPGNIRELENVSKRYLLYAANNLNSKNPQHQRHNIVEAIGSQRILSCILNAHQFSEQGVTVELIETLKVTFNYSMEKIGQVLGVSRTTLWRLMKDLQS